MDWQATAATRGHEISRLQRTIHRQRDHIRKLRTIITHSAHILRDHDKRAEVAERESAAHKAQNEKLVTSMRQGARHGIVLGPDEDRVEAMASLLQRDRDRMMEQHRALSQLLTAAVYVIWGYNKDLDNPLGGLDTDRELVGDLYTIPAHYLENLLVAVRGAQGVIRGSKSLETLSREQAQLADAREAQLVRIGVIHMLKALILTKGPIRKRNLTAIVKAVEILHRGV